MAAPALARFAAVAVGLAGSAAAQDLPPLPSAPEAAALGKFIDVPVTLRTGTLGYSVPLATVRGHAIELPLALDYHGGGIKAAEAPGWIGAGWSLRAGGAVTRTVRGLPDELAQGYVETGHRVWAEGGQNPTAQFVADVLDGQTDPEPDLFYYSAPGASGQFALVPEAKRPDYGGRAVLTIPRSADRVVMRPGGGWDVTTPDGTTYEFTVTDDVQDEQVDASGVPAGQIPSRPPAPTAWHLSRIVSPTGDVVALTYDDVSTVYKTGVSEQLNMQRLAQGCENSSSRVSSVVTSRVPHLRTITSAHHRVEFFRSTHAGGPRAPSGTVQQVRLDSVRVSTAAGERVLAVRLHHAVLGDPGGGGDGRLFLTGVETVGRDGVRTPPYVFEYDLATESPYAEGELAPFDARGIDHLGFANGAANVSLLPDVLVPSPSGTPRVIGRGADREPDGRHALRGLLTAVTLPTGGEHRFEYGTHDYGYVGHQPVSYEALASEQAHADYDAGRLEHRVPFTVGGTGDVYVTGSVNAAPSPCIVGEPLDTDGCERTARIENASGETVRSFDTDGDVSFVLTGGQAYTLVAEADLPGNDIQVVLSWTEPSPTPTPGSAPPLAGGARVERVTLRSPGQPDVVSAYTYRDPDEPDRSSGVLGVEPSYHLVVEGGGLPVRRRLLDPPDRPRHAGGRPRLVRLRHRPRRLRRDDPPHVPEPLLCTVPRGRVVRVRSPGGPLVQAVAARAGRGPRRRQRRPPGGGDLVRPDPRRAGAHGGPPPRVLHPVRSDVPDRTGRRHCVPHVRPRHRRHAPPVEPGDGATCPLMQDREVFCSLTLPADPPAEAR